jgi:hypothetical protein
MRKSILLLLCCSIFLVSCWDWGRRPVEPVNYQKVWGYKPVYTTDTSLLKILSEAPRTMKNPGKIYIKDHLIFQNDIGYGIHVIDNSNPSQARSIGFIRVNGSSEMSIKGNYMYVNSYNALVVVDIADWQHVREVKRVANAFQQGVQGGGGYQSYYIPPPEHGVYYECSSGLMMTPGTIQSGWVRDSIYNYNCYYN